LIDSRNITESAIYSREKRFLEFYEENLDIGRISKNPKPKINESRNLQGLKSHVIFNLYLGLNK
jgi:hypothetical protein